jgi:diphosphomevalonate decarboxylase
MTKGCWNKMSDLTATAVAHPNIAFIKYWGNRDAALRLPASGSLSMNLDGLETRTRVEFDPNLAADSLTINERKGAGQGLARVSAFLDVVRKLSGSSACARVTSANNFPTGAGIASSAAAFAALAMAASAALGLRLTERELSRLARRGSGSACRSIPGGFAEWQAGSADEDSFAFSIAPPQHWDLVDLVAVVSSRHKDVVSSQGHDLAQTSPFQAARLAGAEQRLAQCRTALLECNFQALADVVELDSNMMHAVMMTSNPALFYWEPTSLDVMSAVRSWRRLGEPVCYTVDAGPNVHVITLGSDRKRIEGSLYQIPGVRQVISAVPGGPTRLIT